MVQNKVFIVEILTSQDIGKNMMLFSVILQDNAANKLKLKVMLIKLRVKINGTGMDMENGELSLMESLKSKQIILVNNDSKYFSLLSIIYILSGCKYK